MSSSKQHQPRFFRPTETAIMESRALQEVARGIRHAARGLSPDSPIAADLRTWADEMMLAAEARRQQVEGQVSAGRRRGCREGGAHAPRRSAPIE